MQTESKPLFTLTIGEFTELTKRLVDEALSLRKEESKEDRDNAKIRETHFTIDELADFLRCSRVSIHKYKKMGLPFYRLGRKVLFKKQEVLNFVKTLRNKRIIEA